MQALERDMMAKLNYINSLETQIDKVSDEVAELKDDMERIATERDYLRE